jgi:hypothetical protein
VGFGLPLLTHYTALYPTLWDYPGISLFGYFLKLICCLFNDAISIQTISVVWWNDWRMVNLKGSERRWDNRGIMPEVA